MNKETLSTSEKEVPKIKLGLQEKYDQEKKEEPHAKRLDENNIKEVADQLPEPVGYRILVLPFTPKEKTKGGILFSQEQLDKARIATTCGYVLKMGDLAYKDKEKFGKPPVTYMVEDSRCVSNSDFCWNLSLHVSSFILYPWNCLY